MTGVPEHPEEQLSGHDLAELARAHGLTHVGVRPRLTAYVAKLWGVRQFIYAFASTRTYTRNENTYLGQLWNILNPLMFAGVYYVVFGLVLDTRAGVENFAVFLVIGVTVFQYIAQTVSAGASSITGNSGLIRSLAFPRAALPLSSATSEVLNVLPGLGVAVIVALLTGEVPDWEWLWLLVVLPLVAVFTAGVALFLARLVNDARDMKNLIPHAIRVLRYGSGVFFSVDHYAATLPFGAVLIYQPFALAMDLTRGAMMSEYSVDPLHVLIMAGWAVLSAGIGLTYFWAGEGRYGRQ